MKYRSWILSTVTLLGACAGEEADRGASPVLEEAAWEEELLDHRAAKDAELATSETSPMAGIQYLKSDPGVRFHLSFDGEAFGLAAGEGPDDVLAVERADSGWRWHGLGRGIEVDPELASSPVLEEPALFTLERFRLRFYPSEDRVTFIVFDPERSEATSFEELLYFPPDRRYAVRAELVEHRHPEKVVMLTNRNLEKTFYRFATLRFELEGSAQELSAFKYALEGEESSDLFIPFRDPTSGKETYGAGRFLSIEEPAESDFVLDFNRAFNPFCNYSPAFNCTIPPRENHLSVAIRAGERTYPH